MRDARYPPPDPATRRRIRAQEREQARKRAALERRWHTIYKLYDGKRRLLYVDISANQFARLSQHQRKPWWRKVASAEFEHVKGRTTAEARELALIEELDPKHNVRGKITQQPLPVTVEVHEIWTDEQKVARILRALRVRRSTIADLAERTEIPADVLEPILAKLHQVGRVRPWRNRRHWEVAE